jgi:hypothetical protein
MCRNLLHINDVPTFIFHVAFIGVLKNLYDLTSNQPTGCTAGLIEYANRVQQTIIIWICEHSLITMHVSLKTT